MIDQSIVASPGFIQACEEMKTECVKILCSTLERPLFMKDTIYPAFFSDIVPHGATYAARKNGVPLADAAKFHVFIEAVEGASYFETQGLLKKMFRDKVQSGIYSDYKKVAEATMNSYLEIRDKYNWENFQKDKAEFRNL